MKVLSVDQLRLVVKKKVEKTKLIQLRNNIIKAILDEGGYSTYNLLLNDVCKQMDSFKNMSSRFEGYIDSNLEDVYYDTHKKYLQTKTKEELINEMMEDFLYGINFLENNNIEDSYEDFHSIYPDSCNEFVIKGVKIVIVNYYKDFLESLGGNKND